ncbi:MAG: replicative DNA helicase [Coriobacteriia bacterium]|nr:replicative DNA helicase [Coriobacteriia bacterium]
MPDFAQGNQAEDKQSSLPQNIEAEKTILAACLLSTGVFEEVSLKVKPEDFVRNQHQLIFSAMREMNSKSIVIDAISVADYLNSKNELEQAGGVTYLLELADNTFAFTSWQHHAEIVARDALRRQLLRAAGEIKALAYDSPNDAKELVSQAEAKLFGVTEGTVSSTFKGIQELNTEAIEEIVKMSQRDDSMQGVPTGFKDVDKLFNGFRGGDLVILAARPAVGKTSFAMNLATNAAKLGSTVALFSLEMSSIQITQRLLCAEAGLELHRMRGGFLRDEDWEDLIRVSSNLSNCSFFIDDSPSLSLTELRTKARREMRDIERGIIIIDYLQLMQPVIPHPNNRNQEVAEISRGLKVLAKELDVPILALSQLSRSVEQRSDKRPMLSDLRESGSIEQDADIVMFIDRSTSEAEAEADGRPDWGTANLIVAKHRNGATADITLSFIPEYTKFGDYFDDSSY